MIRNWQEAVAFAEIMLRGVRDNVAEHGFLVPTAFMQLALDPNTGETHPDGYLVVLPINMNLDKQDVAAALRSYAEKYRADMVMVVTECYMLPSVKERDIEKVVDSGIASHPDSLEIALVTLEFAGQTTSWMAPLVESQVGVFSRIDGQMEGRFSEILTKPRVLH